MRMTLEAPLGDTIAHLITGATKTLIRQLLPYADKILVSLQVPDDQSVVARTRQEHVGVLEGSGEGLEPSVFLYILGGIFKDPYSDPAAVP